MARLDFLGGPPTPAQKGPLRTTCRARSGWAQWTPPPPPSGNHAAHDQPRPSAPPRNPNADHPPGGGAPHLPDPSPGHPPHPSSAQGPTPAPPRHRPSMPRVDGNSSHASPQTTPHTRYTITPPNPSGVLPPHLPPAPPPFPPSNQPNPSPPPPSSTHPHPPPALPRILPHTHLCLTSAAAMRRADNRKIARWQKSVLEHLERFPRTATRKNEGPHPRQPTPAKRTSPPPFRFRQWKRGSRPNKMTDAADGR
jgi:hypothetical protein